MNEDNKKQSLEFGSEEWNNEVRNEIMCVAGCCAILAGNATMVAVTGKGVDAPKEMLMTTAKLAHETAKRLAENIGFDLDRVIGIIAHSVAEEYASRNSSR